MTTARENWEMECPSCGFAEMLEVVVTVWARLTPGGTDADISDDPSHEWGRHSPCRCVACKWTGTVQDASDAFDKTVVT